MLDAVVEEHLRQHNGDVEASLIAATEGATVADDLRQVADSEVANTLSASSRRRTNRFRARAMTRDTQIFAPTLAVDSGQVFLADDTELKREVAVKENQRTGLTTPDADSDFYAKPP